MKMENRRYFIKILYGESLPLSVNQNLIQISASDIDFWNQNHGTDWYDDLEHNVTYPPRFTVTADGSSASRNAVLEVTFAGLNKKYQPNFRLICTNRTRTSSVRSLASPIIDGMCTW